MGLQILHSTFRVVLARLALIPAIILRGINAHQRESVRETLLVIPDAAIY